MLHLGWWLSCIILLFQDDYPCHYSLGCPCSRIENRKTNRIVLHSLEEVEVKGGRDDADHNVELVRLLCKCHATVSLLCEELLVRAARSVALCLQMTSMKSPCVRELST